MKNDNEKTREPQYIPISEHLYDINAETGVLGALFLDESDKFIHEVREEYFYNSIHKTIFRTMREMYDEGKFIDASTLATKLKGKGKLTNELMVELNEILDAVLGCEAFENHLNTLKNKYHSRNLIATFNDAVNRIKQNEDVENIASIVTESMLDLYRETNNGSILSTQKANQKVMDMVDDCFTYPDKMIKTWYGELDRLLGRIAGGSLVIIGGRPGMGKSVLGTCLILNNITNNIPCGLINYEMSTEDTMIRMLSNISRKPYTSLIRSINASDQDAIQKFVIDLGNSMEIMHNLPFYQEDRPRGDLQNLEAIIIRMVTVFKCRAIFIDYLQLISAPGKKDKVVEIGEITKACKTLAKRFGIVIFLLSQLNRKLEDRTDKRPRLSDLRESGNIEQDADVVIMCYRDEYYEPNNTPSPGIMEAIIAKNRHGITGTVELYFEGDTSMIASIDTY